MHVAHDVLQRFLKVPSDPKELRRLLDDTGLEVKRVETDASGRTVFTLELLANRGDHHCYEGVATELNGRLGTGVRRPELARLESAATGPWALDCQTPRCLVYSATLLERTGEGSLPADALRVLEAAGIHSLTAPVDASNIANLEVGQPTHAFDADTIDGPVVIRDSVAGETALPLFAEDRVELPEGTLVIADRSKILAIAGVIGCEESKTTASTTRLLLESATFDPVAVRKASRALDINTDSSARFERGADPTRPLIGAGRVVALLEQAGWTRSGPTGVVGEWTDPERTIVLDTALASRFLGMDIDPMRAAELLTRYGFRFGTSAGQRLVVSVPPHRLWDVEFSADLYEELAKAIGYNDTPIALPPVDLGALPAPWEIRKRTIEDVLIGNGFYEVFTDGFYGTHVRDQLGIVEGHPLWAHVQTTNAIERNYALLKNNNLAQALDCVAANARMRNDDVRAWEWTRTFHPVVSGGEGIAPGPGGEGHAPCVETRVLWGVVCGSDRPATWAGGSRPADVLFLKGVFHELGLELGRALTLGPLDPSHPLASLLHDGRRAAVLLDGAPVGLVGEVHPSLVRSWKLKKLRPTFFELDSEALLHAEPRHSLFDEPPEWHFIERSLAFGIPAGFEAGRVADVLRVTGPDWLDGVAITDLFVTEEDGSTVRAVTYRLRFANDPADRRSADSVNAVCEAMVAAVHDQLGDAGVAQR